MLLAAALVPSDASALATEAPPGQPSEQPYEVFLEPPFSNVGSFETRVRYETASGQSGERALPESPGEAILIQETLGSSGSPSTPAGVLRIVLTSGAVAAVSVDGGTPIPTIPAVGPPYELRSALYEIPGVKLGELIARKPSVRVVLTPLNASDQPIDEAIPPQKPLPNPALETRSWIAPAPAAQGVCRIAADRFPGLTAESGSVVSVLRPLVGALGEPYLTCASTRYVYRFSSTDESSLESFMVLDAEHPRAEPEPMPAMEPVVGQPDAFQSRVTSRELVARRVHGAWLLVEGGRDLQQRLTLLANLRGSVQLKRRPTHRHASRKRRS